MCEEKIAKMKKDMRLAKRRARRLLQIYDFVAHPSVTVPAYGPTSSESESSDQLSPIHTQRLTEKESIACLQDVAARTVVLMKRNEEIQRKVTELKRETAEYLTSVMNNPDHQRRFLHILGNPTPFDTPPDSEDISDTSSMKSQEEYKTYPDTDLENTFTNDNVKIKMEIKEEA